MVPITVNSAIRVNNPVRIIGLYFTRVRFDGWCQHVLELKIALTIARVRAFPKSWCFPATTTFWVKVEFSQNSA
jgi:hypothetical protein